MPERSFSRKLLAGALETFARFRLRRHQQIEQTLFGILFGPLSNLLQPFFAHHVDRDIHQVANNRFNVAAHIADFGEFARFYFQKWRIGELCETAGNLRLADSGRADHQNVLRHHLVGHFGIQLLPSYTVPQRDRHGTFGVTLPDHVFVEFRDNLAGRQLIQQRCFFRRLLRQIDHHQPSSS